VDPVAIARRAGELSIADWTAAHVQKGRVFFDRGLGVALAAYEPASRVASAQTQGLATRFDKRVFMARPWPKVFAAGAARRHGFAQAVEEYERLCLFYPRHGFDVVIILKAPIEQRFEFIVANLSGHEKTPPDGPEGSK